MNISHERIEELRSKVESNGGILTLSMVEIREVAGARRLGSNIRADLGKALRKAGIGHNPEILPNNQFALVRLYLQDSPLPRIIEALDDLSPESDSILVDLFGKVHQVKTQPTSNEKRGRGRPRKVAA